MARVEFDGGKVALPEWENIALNERTVRIVFDSDVSTKAEVATALGRLKAFLDGRSANVEVIYLPDLEGGKKQGVDDFLAAGHDLADLDSFASANITSLPTKGSLPTILVSNRQMREIAQDCWQVITADNEAKPRAYKRDGHLVSIDGIKRRSTDQVVDDRRRCRCTRTARQFPAYRRPR